eukprot:CAMPEP_0119303544 /NCGR_PEP_ID=MMETSP1333-20130426/4968_1 /TAXON_ID=418940 /ORGANISM="Scyphosphaera apsteinii, Strain RCC1455" /LENGTH=346 /DNA_ID=CAMNT_0007306253 /DNA_START=268 /DNA_END=1305 /DNA_ORIENTATION=+
MKNINSPTSVTNSQGTAELFLKLVLFVTLPLGQGSSVPFDQNSVISAFQQTSQSVILVKGIFDVLQKTRIAGDVQTKLKHYKKTTKRIKKLKMGLWSVNEDACRVIKQLRSYCSYCGNKLPLLKNDIKAGKFDGVCLFLDYNVETMSNTTITLSNYIKDHGALLKLLESHAFNHEVDNTIPEWMIPLLGALLPFLRPLYVLMVARLYVLQKYYYALNEYLPAILLSVKGATAGVFLLFLAFEWFRNWLSCYLVDREFAKYFRWLDDECEQLTKRHVHLKQVKDDSQTCNGANRHLLKQLELKAREKRDGLQNWRVSPDSLIWKFLDDTTNAFAALKQECDAYLRKW